MGPITKDSDPVRMRVWVTAPGDSRLYPRKRGPQFLKYMEQRIRAAQGWPEAVMRVHTQTPL